MRNTLIIALLCLTSTKALTQPGFEWVKTVGGTGNDRAISNTIDAFGNIYTVGFFTGTVDFDPSSGFANQTSNGGIDMYVMKQNAQGDLLWVNTFGGTGADIANSITSDSFGNIILTGRFEQTVDFDPGSSVFNLYSANYQVFVLKLSSVGDLIWVKAFGSPDSEDTGNSITCDNNNNIYTTGSFYETADFDPGVGIFNITSAGVRDCFVHKLDPNGNFLWVRTLGSTAEDEGYSMDTDNANNLYITGYFSETVDFDLGSGISLLTANGLSDGFIQKMDQNGNFIWVKSIGGTDYDAINTVVCGTTDIYMAGNFRNVVDLDPGSAVSNVSSFGERDIFVLKMDLNGDFVWGKTIGGSNADAPLAIANTGNGDVLVAGYFLNTVDFDPGTGIASSTASVSAFDAFILSLNSIGDYVWHSTIGGTAQDFFTDIVISPSNEIYLTGYFASTVDFDPSSGIANQTSNGGSDAFLLKLYQCLASTSTQSHTACSSYTWNGTTYNSTGTYTYVTTNAAGCDSTATLNLTIEDVTAPVPNMATLSNVTSECSVTSLTAPTATDNCAGTITGTHNATLPITSQGTTVVTWTYDDGNGNTSTQTQNVVIDDVTAPVANVASLSDITFECSVTSLTAPTATDNCAGTITGTHNTTLPITTQGITVVTWTYNDGNGNTSTQTQNVVIDDVTAPVANVASLSNITSECSVTSLTAPTATDNCAGTITGTHNATLPITTQGTTVVTWTYNDGNGNTSTQTQNVVIDDVTAPVANVGSLPNITSECSVTSLTAPTATDNCAGTITGTHNATLPITTQGTTVVTWTYADGNGNTSSQTQNVVIDDVTAPVANVGSLPNITAECSVTSLTAPTATDNCAGTITGTHNATLPITSQGTTVVTWTYNDGNGNTSTQTQNVVIDDVTAPVANVASLSDITSECSVTSLTAPTATDNCAGTITGTHNATLPITTQGTTVVTWTYNDGNGNTSTQTQNVVIDDVTAPIANVASLSDITSACSVTSLTAPTATDNCAGTITGTHNATLPITTQGTTVVTWTYDDGNGNTSTQTQNVVIDDVTAPIANVASLSDITSACSVTSLTAPTATDNCAGTITGTHNATLPITTQGTTVVTWTYDDGNGNTSSQTQDVVITPIDNGITQVDAITLSANASGYSYQWVDCNNGNAPVSGATNQTFTPATAGSYACLVDNGTCSVMTDCLSSSLSLNEFAKENTVRIFPNPATSELTIHTEDIIISAIIIDATGRTIFVNLINGKKIDVSSFSDGVYILQMETEKGFITKKFIKE